MPYISSQDLINNALFRSGEVAGSSDWDVLALDYLNRNYELVCAGATEYLSENIEDWWWLREKGVLTILPTYKEGTVDVVTDSPTITFTPAPPISLQGYRIRFANSPDVFLITSHSAAGVVATLDSAFNGVTNTANAFTAMKTTYDLSASVSAIISPLISFRQNPQISGMEPERMDTLWPLGRLAAGVPEAFSLENERIIRFSHGGLDNGTSMRMEYRYRPAITPLLNQSNSIPLVPLQFRPILVEMMLVNIFSDKNDDRITVATSAARAGMKAMVLENKRRLVKMDLNSGAIITRPAGTSQYWDRRLRTESGLIIG